MSPKVKYILIGAIIGTVVGVWFLYIFAPVVGALVALWLWNRKNSRESENEETSPSLPKERKKLSVEATKMQYCVAVWATATAAAYADGSLEESAKNEAKSILRPFLENLAPEQRKPAAVLLLKFKEEHPQPSLDDAEREIEALSAPDYNIFDHIVQRIIRADSNVSEAEKTFLTSWKQYIDHKNGGGES